MVTDPVRFTSFGICELQQVDPEKNRRRFYCIDLQPGLFELILSRRWGRLGCKPREIRMYFSDTGAALSEANRLYREKSRKGYRELTDSVNQ